MSKVRSGLWQCDPSGILANPATLSFTSFLSRHSPTWYLLLLWETPPLLLSCLYLADIAHDTTSAFFFFFPFCLLQVLFCSLEWLLPPLFTRGIVWARVSPLQTAACSYTGCRPASIAEPVCGTMCLFPYQRAKISGAETFSYSSPCQPSPEHSRCTFHDC